MTTYHKQDKMLTLEESPVNEFYDSFKRLQKGKRLLIKELYHMGIKHIPYIMVAEYHPDSGFPHYHFIMFTSLTIDQQIRLRNKYESWGIGSFEHGLDFDERPDNRVRSLRNYLMKYMAKSFPDYRSKYEESPWTKEQLLFNAVAWRYHFRTWCASNDLSRVMAYHPDKNQDIQWLKTVLNSPTCDELELWKDQDKIDSIKAMIEGL